MSWFKKIFGGVADRRVTLLPSQRDFIVTGQETILERALKQGIDYPHDCTVGTCGSCRSRLVSGSVDAITPFGYTLSKEELGQGYILACQAQPRTDVVIEVELGARAMPEVRSAQGRIIAIEELTHDIRRVRWETDGRFDYIAGQYVNIRWPGGPGPRSYSLCEPPATAGRDVLSAFVRRVPGGSFSELLFAGAPRDITFELEGPHGNFWLRNGSAPILCIAGGSGLSPLMSLLEDAAARGVRRDALLLFGGRAARDLYCQEQIASIARRWSGRFDFWPVLSDVPEEGLRSDLVTAHIDEAIGWLGAAASVQAYLCGPPPMVDAAIESLAVHDVPLSAIFYDKFTDASTASVASGENI